MNLIEQIEALKLRPMSRVLNRPDNEETRQIDQYNQAIDEVLELINSDIRVSSIMAYDKSGDPKDLIPLAEWIDGQNAFCICGFNTESEG